MAIQEHPRFKAIVAQCALGKFKRIDTVPGMEPGPIYIVLSINPPIAELVVTPNTVDLGIIKVHYMHSLNIACGFLFEMPRLRVNTSTNYIKVYRPEYANTDYFVGVKVVFANEHFTIFNANDMATFVALNTKNHLYLTQEKDYEGT